MSQTKYIYLGQVFLSSFFCLLDPLCSKYQATTSTRSRERRIHSSSSSSSGNVVEKWFPIWGKRKSEKSFATFVVLFLNCNGLHKSPKKWDFPPKDFLSSFLFFSFSLSACCQAIYTSIALCYLPYPSPIGGRRR